VLWEFTGTQVQSPKTEANQLRRKNLRHGRGGDRRGVSNFQIESAISDILKRHPTWTRYSQPDEEAAAQKAAMAKEAMEREAAEKKRKEEERYARRITAFGQTKSIAEWANDDIHGKWVDAEVLAGRIERGWEPRKAIEMDDEGIIPKYYDDKLKAKREAEKKAELERRRRLADDEEKRARFEIVAAFGEEKPPSQWADDKRCHVVTERLVARLKAGWPAEKAITTYANDGDPEPEFKLPYGVYDKVKPGK
jgi:hypothetical protein